MKTRWILLVTLLAACAHTKVTTGPRMLTPSEIARRALPSVVEIQTATSLGTGFVVWPDGRIITNLHVIAGAKEARVTLSDGRGFTVDEVVAADPDHDLVILKLPVKNLPALPLGDIASVHPGDPVVAIGHPMGLGDTISNGLISAVREPKPGVTLLQVSAPISPGSSGGPLLDAYGNVIAVSTLFSTEAQNLNFGVPVTYIKPLLLADDAAPIASFPSHEDDELLAGCEPDDVKGAVEAIESAIDAGVPLFNKGDHQACYDLYKKTALAVVDKVKSCQGIPQTLLDALQEATRAQDPGEQAWAIRHAFDRILKAVEAALDEQQKSR